MELSGRLRAPAWSSPAFNCSWISQPYWSYIGPIYTKKLFAQNNRWFPNMCTKFYQYPLNSFGHETCWRTDFLHFIHYARFQVSWRWKLRMWRRVLWEIGNDVSGVAHSHQPQSSIAYVVYHFLLSTHASIKLRHWVPPKRRYQRIKLQVILELIN
jgi:hypothetical protein